MTLEILSSPYYQRREGRNHLLVVVDWRALKLVLYHDRQQRYPMEEQLERLGETFKLAHYTPAAPAIFGAFRNVTRHFVLAQKVGRPSCPALPHCPPPTPPPLSALSTRRPSSLTARSEPRPMKCHVIDDETVESCIGSLISPYQRTAKVITVPHLAPSSVQGCTFREGRVVCNQAYTGEANFDSYRRSRNYSLFFLGNTERHEVPGSRKCSHSGEDCMRQLLEQRKLLRPLVVFELGGLGARNVLASSKAPQGLPPKRACSFDGPQQVTTECVCPPLEPARVSKLLHLSEFAVHVQGDDASSSRVYEAIASGTPQLFLAGRYFGDIAPFKCRVDWGRMVYWLETDEFRANPEGTMRGVLRGFREDPSEWQRLWEAQREAANDLLWHMPQSRVAQNVVEDALRAIDVPPPPAEPPAQPAADRV